MALYMVAGALVGAILPDLIPHKYLKYFEMLLIAVPVLGMAQTVLFLAGLRWLERQIGRIDRDEPPESQPWYMDWNEFVTGYKKRTAPDDGKRKD